MKVAIDSGALVGGHSVRGIGFYTKNIIASLKTIERKTKDISISELDFKKNSDLLSEYDILHFPYYDLFYSTLPSKKITKTVLTIHDVIPLIYPTHYPSGLRGKINFYKQRKALSLVDHIITDTESSKKDIVRFLSVDPDKITPIYLSHASHFKKISSKSLLEKVRIKYSLPREFVLYVGDVNYNKNIGNLIEACELLSVNLVIVGKQAGSLEDAQESLKSLKGPQDWLRYLLGRSHPELAHLKMLLEKLSKSEKVIRLGFVPDNDLVAIYNLASVYCQPSLYEGFGLPVLEAMSCGVPVVISKTQALVEISKNNALISDPNDAGSFASNIKKLLYDKKLFNKYSKLGLDYSKNFSWNKTALQTIEVYKSI